MSGAFGWRNAVAYGLMGLPLAFAALPLYVILPNHYARQFGVPLAALGAVLLGARLLDALIDPWLGRFNDWLMLRSSAAVLAASAVAAALLAAGLLLLFFPTLLLSEPSVSDLLRWAALMLMLTYLGYSLLSISHQSWGALLGGNEAQRGRITGTREALALAGVLLAAVLPSLLGLPGALALFAGFLLLAWWTWRRSVPPQSLPNGGGHIGLMQPLRDGRFVRLLGVFMLNGIASAVPATLVLFFVQDRLQAPTQMEPAFLGVYFLSAAVSIPLWLALVRRLGLARSWLLGMVLAVLVFIWAGVLSAGDAWLFLGVCALSGLALGADLALPSAMLAGLLQLRPGGPAMAGAYFGWWNFAAKLNLALAAGLALPLLEGFGYQPGARDPQALQALTLAYCILPCVLKVLACWGLYVGIIRAEPRPVQEVSS
jgi:glycoside/pentoside/hexuronide:cation symporter, GPH family